MEDDEGLGSTVVIKARSAYTWLDKLRFLKGLLPPPPTDELALVRERDSHAVYQCADLDMKTLEETCKVLFQAKEKQLGRKSRKLCLATEHILKELKQCTGQVDEAKSNGNANGNLNGNVSGSGNGNGRAVEVWEERVEEVAVGSMNGGGVEEERFWTSGASERSEEAPGDDLSPKRSPVVSGQNGCRSSPSPLKQNGRTSRLDSFASEPPPVRPKVAGTRNRRSVSDLAANIAAKTQKMYKFEEARVVTQEHRQRRSGLKRRLSSEENGKTKRQPTSVPEPAVAKPSSTPVLELASDHPSQRPPESLVYITYQVFLQAGRGGLTAREAANRIEDVGLGACFQGLVKPRIKIGKIIRNNPYYFQAGEGRYILCEAVVGVTHPALSLLPQFQPGASGQDKSPVNRKEAAASARREGTARYWADLHATGRNVIPKSRYSKPVASMSNSQPGHWDSDEICGTLKDGEWDAKTGKEESQPVVQAHAKPRLKGMYKSAVGGKPCKRSDGKNWQCPLMAPPNSNYCEHHQKRMVKDTAET